MPDFDAGSFSDISETNLAKKIWSFLNTDENFIRFETATELRRPALEPLQRRLLDEFGNEIRGDRWKQMMGRMVRQIMEHHGYSLDQTGIRIRNGEIFTSAARYKKRT